MTTEIPLDDPRRHTTVLTASPKGAAIGRRVARRQLTTWGLNFTHAEPYYSALLIVAELAANAITHGRVPGRGFELHLSLTTTVRRGTTLRIEVSDCRGDRLPVLPARLNPNSQSGRGLTLVDALADRWGTIPRHPNGKTIWAELDLPNSGADAS
ncbi:ATP-binding protein [Streptomyces kaniharaensis]|uniref:ATP-binding protein n=1 Tax=Streptomyces kaniharaensis TaxID=212423 RepID=A0A6N7L017_9ACTN|nr:ATP-binding protein [Streptomyces kaniharaensis]MQS16961.1 ATP-binding protein [Streptomyces kaniharaensis]